MQLNYKGLSNIGATCYMNSLLQTLFMTPQFRQAIYRWEYNQKIHPTPTNSIIYQLQRLFGKLQRSFPGEVSTKDLVKSFQWEDQEAQMQQDIQQFNRVLFQALEKSLIGKKKLEIEERSHFMRDLYEGEMVAYTKCGECEYQSQREEVFQDVILNVKNAFQKVYNSSIELAIQRYMKPEYLDENNLYECSGCLKKVKAERGVRFLKMPKLLNIILRRFDFDYFTFQRIKVNDRVQFPFVLNFNKYMNGYHNIKDKLDEDSSAYFVNENVPNKKFPKANTTQMKKVNAKKPTPVGKKNVKPSSNTKSFLQDIRRKKMMSQQDDADQFYVSGPPPPTKKVQSTFQPIIQEKIQPERKLSKSQPTSQEVNTAQLKEKQLKMQSKQTKQTKESQQKQEQKQKKLQNLLPPPIDLTPPPLSQPYKVVEETKNIEDQLAEKVKEKEKLSSDISERLKENQKLVKELTEKYLEDGPLVYELYAVLVHSGTATHGHYYSYIKSFQDGKWYCFNDDRVIEVNVLEIEKAFGGVGHANAYALYYRMVDQQQNERKTEIPVYIKKLLEEETENMKRREVKRIQDLQNIITLKMHYQLYVKQLQIHKNSSLDLCLDKAREMFDITEESVKKHNSRLRMFNPISETKQQTFTGREQLSLTELKIPSFKSMLLQTKKQEEKFEEFIVGLMNIRVVFWEQSGNSLKSLDESYLKLHTVAIPYNATMRQVQKRVKQKRKEVLEGIEKEEICIVKRHQNDEYSYHQIINENEYKEKNVQQVMVMENQILFIEPDSNELMWPQEFENQLYRITIKYNNPSTGEVNDYMTDSRLTLLQLKTKLCQLLDTSIDDLIMKRGTKSGLEMKNLSVTLKESRFITGTQLYFQKGIPAKVGEIRVQLFMAYDAPIEMSNRLHEFEFIGDVPVNGLHRASEVKDLFAKVMKKYRDMDLEKGKFRIREKVSDKIGKIYREKPMKEQQLIEKRQIAIQLKEDTIDQKDNSIYVRIWNPLQWTLSEKMEIVVSKTTTMKELAAFVHSSNPQVPVEKMEICRILSIHKLSILDLCDMEYYQMTEASVMTEPLFVNADGLLYIVKNCELEPRPLTKEEQIKFGGTIKSLVRVRPRPSNPNYKKEKGVTIKVMEKQQQDKKNEKKAEEKKKQEEKQEDKKKEEKKEDEKKEGEKQE